MLVLGAGTSCPVRPVKTPRGTAQEDPCQRHSLKHQSKMIPGNQGDFLEEVTLRQGHHGTGRWGVACPRREAAGLWTSNVAQGRWDSSQTWVPPTPSGCRGSCMDGETGTAEVGPYPRAGLHGIHDGCVCALGECAWAVQCWVCVHTRSIQCPPYREDMSVGRRECRVIPLKWHFRTCLSS